jgi:putative SOS response-associated peptidase YedK
MDIYETSGYKVQELIANPLQDFEAYRVSTRVNSARNEGADLLQRL